MIHFWAQRGLRRRKDRIVAPICVDETSYRKGYKYVTVVSDAKVGTVLYEAVRERYWSGGVVDVRRHSWKEWRVYVWTCGRPTSMRCLRLTDSMWPSI